MNKSPTAAQVGCICQMLEAERVSSRGLQELIESGFSDDLFEAARLDRLGTVDRSGFKRMFGIPAYGVPSAIHDEGPATIRQIYRMLHIGDTGVEVTDAKLEAVLRSELLHCLFQAARSNKLGAVDRVELRALFYVYPVVRLPTYFDSVMERIRKGSSFWVDSRLKEDILLDKGIDQEGGRREVVLIQLGEEKQSLSAALKKAADLKLLAPSPYDALGFASEHPNVQSEFPIIFPHPPFRAPSVEGQVLWLNVDGDGRGVLDFHPVRLQKPQSFGREFRYAFVKP